MNFHEHDEHRKFFHDHFVVKGAEAATACATTVDKVRHLLSPSGRTRRDCPKAFALGRYDPNGRLVYAGRAGNGINTAEPKRLWHRLARDRQNAA
jgi:hypothetical protein